MISPVDNRRSKPTIEQIRLAASPRVRHHRRGAERLLEREQTFEHADRRVERRAHRTALRFAIPAAVGELFAQQPIDEPIAALAEVCAERNDAAVDARLDLALEEGRVAEPRSPRDAAAHEIDRVSRRRARRVDAEIAQEHQRVHVRPPERRRDAIAPLTVGALFLEQSRSPTLHCDARPLGANDLSRRVGEIAHDLPANRRIAVEEPVDDGRSGVNRGSFVGLSVHRIGSSRSGSIPITNRETKVAFVATIALHTVNGPSRNATRMSSAPRIDRRRFCVSAAATVAAGPLGLLDSSLLRRSIAMTEVAQSAAGQQAAIRPFRVSFPDTEVADMRRRIKATRWPEKETVADATQGVQLATMQKLARYWGTDYDWRKCEARLNALPNFVTEIDGLDIHFIHVRSKLPNALPIIITHGWPGSVIEQLKIIDPLTNPTAHGGTAADAFDVVIPSLPGHGFSGKPTAPGWDPAHIARAWIVLMKRLGYTRYVAQGGDWGDMITELMAKQAPAELIGIHTNMPATVPAEVSKALSSGGPPPAGLQGDEKLAWDELKDFFSKHVNYALEMSTRPETLYGLADSPIALAAWMLDHDRDSYALIARAFDGHPGGLSRDDVLDNVTLYWLTNTGVSSARLYWENKAGFFDAKGGINIPVGVSVFPEELYRAPRSWAERAFPKLVHYNRLDKGGHFAAWEQPQLFTEEVRASFKTVRK